MNRRLFADTATIRAALFDILDQFNPLIMDRNLIPGEVKSEDRENFERTAFVDAVITRVAQLQTPPHDGVKLENLCLTHVRETLHLPPTKIVFCVECERLKREAIG